MADLNYPMAGGVRKLKDMGDGTFAEVVAPVLVDASGNPLGRERVFAVTLTLDTSAYADGDLLAATQEITSFFPAAGVDRALHSILILDEDDQGAAIDLIFLNANEDLGTENGAYAITDAEARSITGTKRIVAGDWIDWGGFRLAEFDNIGKVLRAPSASTSLYVAAVSRGAPTYTASGLKLLIGAL
jgi:hypothetical protein